MKINDSEAIVKISIKNQLCTIESEGFGEAYTIAMHMENNLLNLVELMQEFFKQESTLQ